MAARFYSRVYHDAQTDPRFETIWPDDAALALWLRLLIAADGTWPTPCPVPRTANEDALNALVAAGLVELLPGDLYRIHGLDAERTRRSEAGKRAIQARWDTARNTASNTASISPRNTEPIPNRAEQNRTEQAPPGETPRARDVGVTAPRPAGYPSAEKQAEMDARWEAMQAAR
jgi:hypothetical protein